MATETDRHAGHADIVREMIDNKAGLAPDRSSLPGDGYDWIAYHDRLERIARSFRDRVRWFETGASAPSSNHPQAQARSTIGGRGVAQQPSRNHPARSPARRAIDQNKNVF